MKKQRIYDMKKVATVAHRYRRMTGCSWAMAMAASWSRHKEEKLRELLKTCASVSFIYRKVDGTLRPATGTKVKSKVEQHKATPKGTGRSSEKVVTYFDSSANGWRCFRRHHLHRIVSVVTVNEDKDYRPF